MLSKNNKILVGCLALLLVMSVGYALFSDTIEINGSATAQGEFELTTTCDDDLSAVGWYDNGSVSEDTITCNSNVVNASATLGYPGSQKWFRVMVKNEGTIPAKLKKVVELNNLEDMKVEKGHIPAEIANYNKNAEDTNRVVAILYPGYDWQLDYEDEYEIAASWEEGQLDAVLDPGETAYFYIKMEWSVHSTTPGDPLTASINVQMDWEQVTE